MVTIVHPPWIPSRGCNKTRPSLTPFDISPALSSNHAIANPSAPAQVPGITSTLAAELKQLSPAEKLLLVEELWNDIAKESNTVQPPSWHDQVLAEDAAAYAANPARGDTWANVKHRITR